MGVVLRYVLANTGRAYRRHLEKASAPRNVVLLASKRLVSKIMRVDRKMIDVCLVHRQNLPMRDSYYS